MSRRGAGTLAAKSTVLAIVVTVVGSGFAEAAVRSTRSAHQVGQAVVSRTIFEQARWSMIPPDKNPVGIGIGNLAAFPRSGSTFGILTTGRATIADDRNTQPDSGYRSNGPFVRGSRDVVILRIKVRVPSGHNCLSFRFRFLTEEFPEFVNTDFNDGFIAELDRTTWNTRSNSDPTIVAPRNFAFTSDGKRISVNSAGDGKMFRKYARGTTYDGATRLLRASTRVTRGIHHVYLSIFDQGDRQFDSAAFIDRMTTARVRSCRTGVVVG